MTDLILKTDRLTLRPPTMTDAGRIAKYLNNFAVAGNLSRVPYPYRLTDAKAWLRTQHGSHPPGQATFAIEFRDEGYVGQVGFHPGTGGRTIVGYWLAEPWWGRGIMTEAAAAVLDWYFATTSAESIHSGVFHFNMASLAVQKKLGFTETGRSTLHCLARGEEVEHIDTELTRRVWSQR